MNDPPKMVHRSTEEEQTKDWQAAIDELNHIYKDYGRFATSVGVNKLFEKFGFERTMP